MTDHTTLIKKPDNLIRLPRRVNAGTMNIGAAFAIFTQLDSNRFTFEEKIAAIDIVAHAETLNSIKKDYLKAALRWLFDTFDFEEV